MMVGKKRTPAGYLNNSACILTRKSKSCRKVTALSSVSSLLLDIIRRY